MVSTNVEDSHLGSHEPQTFLTKCVWSQDHKVIASQYMGTATAIGLVALVLSWLMRLKIGFPGTI